MDKVSVNVTAPSRQEGWEERPCMNSKAQTALPISVPVWDLVLESLWLQSWADAEMCEMDWCSRECFSVLDFSLNIAFSWYADSATPHFVLE